jgi:hypothetical protein
VRARYGPGSKTEGRPPSLPCSSPPILALPCLLKAPGSSHLEEFIGDGPDQVCIAADPRGGIDLNRLVLSVIIDDNVCIAGYLFCQGKCMGGAISPPPLPSSCRKLQLTEIIVRKVLDHSDKPLIRVGCVDRVVLVASIGGPTGKTLCGRHWQPRRQHAGRWELGADAVRELPRGGVGAGIGGSGLGRQAQEVLLREEEKSLSKHTFILSTLPFFTHTHTHTCIHARTLTEKTSGSSLPSPEKRMAAALHSSLGTACDTQRQRSPRCRQSWRHRSSPAAPWGRGCVM